MAMNSSGPISLGGATTGQSINLEIGSPATSTVSLNDTIVRTLAGVVSGQIVVPTDFYGKSLSNSYFQVFSPSNPSYLWPTTNNRILYDQSTNDYFLSASNNVIKCDSSGNVLWARSWLFSPTTPATSRINSAANWALSPSDPSFIYASSNGPQVSPNGPSGSPAGITMRFNQSDGSFVNATYYKQYGGSVFNVNSIYTGIGATPTGTILTSYWTGPSARETVLCVHTSSLSLTPLPLCLPTPSVNNIISRFNPSSPTQTVFAVLANTPSVTTPNRYGIGTVNNSGTITSCFTAPTTVGRGNTISLAVGSSYSVVALVGPTTSTNIGIIQRQDYAGNVSWAFLPNNPSATTGINGFNVSQNFASDNTFTSYATNVGPNQVNFIKFNSSGTILNSWIVSSSTHTINLYDMRYDNSNLYIQGVATGGGVPAGNGRAFMIKAPETLSNITSGGFNATASGVNISFSPTSNWPLSPTSVSTSSLSFVSPAATGAFIGSPTANINSIIPSTQASTITTF